MDILEIYKDSLAYPSKYIDNLLTLGVLFFLDGIVSLLPSIAIALNQTLATQILYFISTIVGVVITLIAIGYTISIVKNTILHSDMPSIKVIKNIIDGIKIVLISVIYYIIPSAITLIIAYFTGVLNGIVELSLIYLNYGPEVVSYIPHLSPLSFNMELIISITVIVAFIFILSTLILVIAIARFADTDSIKSSLNIKEVINDISKISWRKYLTLIILFLIILLFILIVTVVVSVIPFVGLIIFFLALLPFIAIFSGRALGLIYREGKEII